MVFLRYNSFSEVIILKQGIPPRKAAKMLGVTVQTLQNWDYSGKFKAHRTPTNRRYYLVDEITAYQQNGSGRVPRKANRENVIYARVSTYKQKQEGSLKRQTEFVQDYANAKGIIIDHVYKDIGSGLNYKRSSWLRLLDLVDEDKINTIFVAFPDRFVRFGFDYFKHFCTKHGTKIVSLNNQNLSPAQEMTNDLISIIHVFSCRLYGLRKYKRMIQKEAKQNEQKKLHI